MLKKTILYFAGTKFKIEYIFDGQHKSYEAILAQVFEEDYVFQIIAISEYEAGYIKGYIKKEFKNVHAVSYDYLYTELERIFSTILKFEIINKDKHTATYKEVEKMVKEFPSEYDTLVKYGTVPSAVYHKEQNKK